MPRESFGLTPPSPMADSSWTSPKILKRGPDFVTYLLNHVRGSRFPGLWTNSGVWY